MIRTSILALISIFCFIQTSKAQSFSDKEKVTQAVEWFTLASNIKVHNKVSILAEGQFRYAQSFDPMQFQLRTGVEYTINKHFSVLQGYVYSWNPLYGKQPASYVNNEHRIFEQITYKHSVGRWNISHRGRLEQRFVQVHQNYNGEIVSEGYDLYLNRARYRLAVNVPLNHAKMEPKTVYASLYDEIFFEWGKNVVYHKPDQNRVFAGLGYQVNKQFSFQGGFFYQTLIKLSGVKQENNVGFHVQVNYNIDLTKKEN
jgi:hypothetical protein